MIQAKRLALPLLALGLLAASSSRSNAATVSSSVQPSASPATTIQGQVSVTSFPTPPTAILLESKGTIVAQADLAADGAFALSVPAGEGYRVLLAAGGISYPLVFPRSERITNTTFRVGSGRSKFDVGLVQFLDPTQKPLLTHRDPLKDKEIITCQFGKVCVDDIEGSEDVCGGPLPVTSPSSSASAPMPRAAAVAEHNLPPTVGC